MDESWTVVRSQPVTPPRCPVVVVCLSARDQAARIAGALRQNADVAIVHTFEALRDELARRTYVDAVIVPARDRDDTSSAPTVRSIVAARPGISVIAHCGSTVADSPDIRALVHAGVHDFLFHGLEGSISVVRSVLASAMRESAAELVLREFSALIPKRLHCFAEYCLRHPDQTSISELAGALGLSRRTLVKYCQRESFPAPRELLSWLRLALAAALLASSPRTVESVAMELGFPSDTSLRNMIKRYTHRRASDIRRSGGVACVADAFRGRILTSPATGAVR